ncbi:S8 family serine peptidase [Sporosarcina siberiensis]|uniref:S8 family serine peptidase n=1 Tax=Sporosarcina siberiensis TaxID=1365606 RepID=A0ABW4SJN0_9BACL
MKRNRSMKFFSAFLAFAMVLSLLSPIASAANEELVSQFKPNHIDESIMQQKAAIAEQLELLGGEARLHGDLQSVSGNQQVAVIVHLSEKSVALQKGIAKLAGKNFTAAQESTVRAKVKAQQSMSKKEMTIKKISFKAGYSFDTVLNGFAVTVKADDIPKLLKITGVTLVEPDTEVHAFQEPKPTKSFEMKNKELESVENTKSDLIKTDEIEAKMNTSISFLGIEKLWREGFEGQGIKVAVLDTGIDASHPEFAGNYKGGKNFVPHIGSDYARPRADNDGSETSPLDRPANRPEFNSNGSAFYTSHGTHVAGTIAAIGNNPYGIKGIAPKVDLYSYRVLGAYGSGSTSGIIKAIDTAVIEKMDVINLSLGGGANSETDGGSFAINNAMLAGTIAAIATGNSGPKRGTMGTPSTARLGIAVGNTTNPEVKHNGKVTIAAGSYQYAKQLNLMATTFGKNLETGLQGEFELVAVPGNGKATDYTGIDVAGKVALISRGEIAFVDKIAFAKENGAIATIIHNFAGGSNAPGESGTFLGDSFEFIPTFDMSVTDATEIRATLQTEQATISFGSFASASTTGDEVNDSSSRGPSTPNFDIKPDVSAPGTNIMSSIPQYGADFPDAKYDQSYDRFTGTSMATPHIAGIAALVKQANPSWNAFDVKVALSNTAKLLDTAKYDVFSQGAGRVDAYAAAHPSALAYAIDTANNNGVVVENLKGTVTFGPQSLANNVTVTKQIRVKDMKGTGGSYAVSVDVKKAFGDATLTIDKPSFNLAGEELLTVTLTASKNANVKTGDEFLGYIHITGGETEISLPFAADFGGAAAVEFKDFKITETDLSFNGDGVKDSALLSFTLTGGVTTNYIELWDIMNPAGGEFADGYIGYLHAGSSLAAGSYTLNVAGKYTPWTTGAKITDIPDGLYTIDFSGKTVSGNPATVGGYVGPVVVKSTAGKIEGTLEGTKVTGKVVDKYIDYNIELEKYGLDYALNTKLKATYEVLENEVVTKTGDITLEPDGTFAFDTGALNKGATVNVKYIDAGGNKAQQLLESDGTSIEYKVDHEELSLKVGETAQLKVTEITTKTDGTIEEKDVTAEATFASSDDTIATVEGSTVTAVAAGETIITVTHPKFTTTVTAIVEPNMQKVVISEADVAAFINDKKAKQIIISVPTYDKEIAIEFSETVLSQIVKSKKALLFTSNGTTIEFEDDAAKELFNKTGGNVTIILGKAVSATHAEALSEEISISIYKGFGESKQSVTTLKEEITITIQIDDSQLAKNAKVEVLDLSTNKTLKAKAKKGNVEFETKPTGTFIVIKK